MNKQTKLFEGKAGGVSVSLPAEMARAIRDLARKNNRPVSREIQAALAAYLVKGQPHADHQGVQRG